MLPTFFRFFYANGKFPFFSFIAQFFTLYLSFIYTTTIRLFVLSFAMGLEWFGGRWMGGERFGSPTGWLTATQLLLRRMKFCIRNGFLWKINIFLNPNCCSYSSSSFFATAVVNLMWLLLVGNGVRQEIFHLHDACSLLWSVLRLDFLWGCGWAFD